jgi:hypothetical protein
MSTENSTFRGQRLNVKQRAVLVQHSSEHKQAYSAPRHADPRRHLVAEPRLAAAAKPVDCAEAQ